MPDYLLNGPLFLRQPAIGLFVLVISSSAGCAGVDVVMLSTESYTPQPNHVESLEREPSRPYVQIAILSVSSLWLSTDSKREKILEKAGSLGADAVVFGDFHLRPRKDTRKDAHNPSSPSSPPEEIEKPALLDDRLSSLQEQNVDADVSVVLVRGGRGGTRGPGGWRGRSWGGYYGPYYGPHYRPWGYRFRPGWWGYGPYWGGPYWGGGYYYDVPYPSYGAYSPYDYGYTNSVTVGTAIHYTD